MADPFGPIGEAIYRNRRAEIDDRGMTIAEAEEARRQADYDRRQAKMDEYAGALNDESRVQGDIAPAAESGALPEQPVARGAVQDTEIQMAPRRVEMQPGPDGTLIAPARDASGSERSPPEAEARAPLSGPENYPADAGDVSGQTSVAPLESGDYQNQPGPVGAAEDRRSDVATKIEAAIRNPKQRRDILRDPERLRRMAAIAAKGGDDKFVEWLKAASLAEKENSFEAMGHLLNNNATAAREAFDGTGDQKTDGTDPIKNDDGKTWTLTLEGGRKVTLDPEHYLETMSNPAKYAERKQKAEEHQAKLKEHAERTRYLGANADYVATQKGALAQAAVDQRAEAARMRADTAAKAQLARAGSKGPQRVFGADEQASIEKAIETSNTHIDPDSGKRTYNTDQAMAQRIASSLLNETMPNMSGQMIAGVISGIKATSRADAIAQAGREYDKLKARGATPEKLSKEQWVQEYAQKAIVGQEFFDNDALLTRYTGGKLGYTTSGPVVRVPLGGGQTASGAPTSGKPMAVRRPGGEAGPSATDVAAAERAQAPGMVRTSTAANEPASARAAQAAPTKSLEDKRASLVDTIKAHRAKPPGLSSSESVRRGWRAAAESLDQELAALDEQIKGAANVSPEEEAAAARPARMVRRSAGALQ